MKKYLTLMIAVCVVAQAAVASAGERYKFRSVSNASFFAAPAFLAQAPPAPAADGAAPAPTADPAAGGAVKLFGCVKYKDHDEMHPCAVPKVISVKDPCDTCCDPCSCCKPKCVHIKICVPPCGCERVKCNKSGTRVTYDYGKYSVDVRVKKGYIEVDYQD